MDLGAHPVYILHYLCGEPENVSAAFSNIYGTSSDESAIGLFKYENGIIGLAETAFVTYGVPDILEVYGSDGYLRAHGNEVTIIAKDVTGSNLVSDLSTDEIEDPFVRFIKCLEEKTVAPTELNIDTALICARIMADLYKNEL